MCTQLIYLFKFEIIQLRKNIASYLLALIIDYILLLVYLIECSLIQIDILNLLSLLNFLIWTSLKLKNLNYFLQILKSVIKISLSIITIFEYNSYVIKSSSFMLVLKPPETQSFVINLYFRIPRPSLSYDTYIYWTALIHVLRFLLFKRSWYCYLTESLIFNQLSKILHPFIYLILSEKLSYQEFVFFKILVNI